MNTGYSIPFHKPTRTAEDLLCLQEVFTGRNWAKESEEGRKFFEDYFAGSPVFFTNSCSSALEMAVRSLGISVDDEVIIPGFGYVAVANAVVNSGARPVYADVKACDGNINVEGIVSRISSRTKAVIAIHYAGNPFDIDGLMKLCKDKNLFVIEDAAQCIGSTYANKPLGAFGHLSCLSFDYMKNVTCGQGGLLIVNQRELVSKVQTIFDNGTDKASMISGLQNYFEWVGKGNNYQINPLASHFLNGQLKSLGSVTEDRLKKWDLYYELLLPLQENKRIALPKVRSGHNGHIFYIITKSKYERNCLRSYLKENGILSENHYTSLARSAYGKKFTGSKELPENAEKLCAQLLRLPLWYQMPDKDISYVVTNIKKFYSK